MDEEKQPKKGKKDEVFKLFQPATPAEMSKILKFYECSPLTADAAVQSKLPGLQFESEPEEQLWRMISTRTWSIHERADQKKIHIHMTCLNAKISQDSLDGGVEVDRGSLREMISPLRDWKEQLLELVTKKYFISSKPAVTIRQDTEIIKTGQKVRSKKFKKLNWEAKIIKVDVHLKPMMSFRSALEVNSVLRSFKINFDDWRHDGVTVDNLFDDLQNRECLLYSPPQEKEKLYQQQRLVCVTVRQGDYLLVQTHHRTSDGTLHKALKPLERLVKATEDGQSWKDWKVRSLQY
jgi:hypothetical protein